MRLAQHKLPIATKFVTRHETALQIAAHALAEEPDDEAGGRITMAENAKTKQRREALRGMSEADLSVVVANAHKNIYQFRKDRLSKPQENVKIVRNSRKEIARALTIKRERELAQENKD